MRKSWPSGCSLNPPAVQAREAARRHRESGQKQWPDVVSTAEVPVFGDPAHEYEKFSADTAWMPTVVLIRQEHLRVAGADEPAVWARD